MPSVRTRLTSQWDRSKPTLLHKYDVGKIGILHCEPAVMPKALPTTQNAHMDPSDHKQCIQWAFGPQKRQLQYSGQGVAHSQQEEIRHKGPRTRC